MLNGDDALTWLLRFHQKVDGNVDELTELDRKAGDGDFGWNISSALSRAVSSLETLSDPTPGTAFRSVSDAFLSTGGTSGPLFGLWFGELATPKAELWTLPDLRTAVSAGTAAVMRLGKAEVGHMTMVDALMPATRALELVDDGTSLDQALALAATAAASGAESTRSMIASRGRASYVGEHARGVVDPGALAVAWFFSSASLGDDS